MHAVLRQLPMLSAFVMLLTLVLCYILTFATQNEVIVVDDHVRWLASVFYIAKDFPESLVFSIGMTVSALLFTATIFTRHYQLKQTFTHLEDFQLVAPKRIKTWRSINVVGTVTGVVGSLLLCSFVGRNYMNPATLNAIAYAAFGFIIIHMYVTTILSHELRKRVSFYNRMVLSIIATSCLAANAILSRLHSTAKHELELAAVVAQYGLFAVTMLFIGLYYYSFTAISFVMLDKPSVYLSDTFMFNKEDDIYADGVSLHTF